MTFTIFLMSLIFERFAESFENTCKESTTYLKLLLVIWKNSFYGLMCFLGLGFICLHCWLNAFSELLRFGDRLFHKVILFQLFSILVLLLSFGLLILLIIYYLKFCLKFKDWWNTPSYLQYYRLWNDVVQDWMFTYIFKDLYEVFRVKNETIIKIVIFFISALFHEYILGISLRIFFPVNFIFFFGSSLLMMSFKKDFGNIYFLCTVVFGFSIQISFYTIEYYARKNCPITNPSFVDILTPRVISCGCFLV